METDQVAIVSFEGMIKRKAIEVKRKLSALENTTSMRLDIEISGRTHSGDLDIEYKLGEFYSGDKMVRGNSIDAVVEEFMRRRGWDAAHAPLQLSQGQQDQYEV